MIFALASKFHIYLLSLGTCPAYCLNGVLNVKGTMNLLRDCEILV